MISAMRTFPPLPALTLVVFLAACAGEPAPSDARSKPRSKQPPIVLISIDTLRSDHLPIYGYRGVETPAIDALRRDAILFERAYSHAPLTLPSHATILTGLLPPAHGVRDNQGYVFEAARLPYLPRLLRERGYATGAAVSAFVLRAETGLAAGFDFYDGRFEAGTGLTFGDVARPGGETLAAVRGWLDGVAGKPFFLFLHLFEPHAPYTPPEPFASRYGASPYDGEIAAVDAVVGALVAELRRLGVYERAVVVLLADHGEGLGDHGEEEHGVFLYREVLQVPLVVKLPGGERAGDAVSEPVQLADVAPTLLELAGLAPAPGLAGRSLLTPGAERQIYAETFYPRLHYGWSELASLIGGRFHYVEAPEPELYDLAADPAERRNVLREERRAYAELRDALAQVERGFTPPGEVDAETRQRLAALGYLGGGAATAGPLPDPKHMYPTLREVAEAFKLYRQGEHAAAVEAFRKVVAENPGMLDAWEYLGDALVRLGRFEEARAAYREGFTAGGAARLALPAAKVSLRLGRLEEAAELLRPVVEAGDVAAAGTLARVLTELGDQTAARRLAEGVLGRAPDDAGAHETLGLIALRGGRAAEAETHTRRALTLAPERPDAWNNLGVALAFQGRDPEALDAWERALALDPQAFDVLFNLGLKAAQLGRKAQAKAALERFVAQAPRERYAADLEQARALLRRL